MFQAVEDSCRFILICWRPDRKMRTSIGALCPCRAFFCACSDAVIQPLSSLTVCLLATAGMHYHLPFVYVFLPALQICASPLYALIYVYYIKKKKKQKKKKKKKKKKKTQ